MGSLNVIALNDALANVTMLGLDTPPIIYFIETHPKYDALVTEIFRRVVVLERPRLRTPSHNTPRDPAISRRFHSGLIGGRNTIARGAILEYIARVKNRNHPQVLGLASHS